MAKDKEQAVQAPQSGPTKFSFTVAELWTFIGIIAIIIASYFILNSSLSNILDEQKKMNEKMDKIDNTIQKLPNK